MNYKIIENNGMTKFFYSIFNKFRADTKGN